ncbi:hypothetical protein AB5J62_24995 [Amycolatopsis sp. cg5]|uniref:hypothetical protein n=1 Tax=Amycolatopsis sp. cg5 TaxID=3238802 RepID=UPI003525BDB0
MDEFYAAMTAGVERGDGYILPALMDSVVIHAELLSPAVVYLIDHESADLTKQVACQAFPARPK